MRENNVQYVGLSSASIVLVLYFHLGCYDEIATNEIAKITTYVYVEKETDASKYI